ncbi:MAG: hypothetical protein Ct9H300mP30_1090 [Methanobacteriota archaeon]|nr:MAG: hypothetical protein Ct9H300mP30_1090 [Euryarchaeota archaeon]
MVSRLDSVPQWLEAPPQLTQAGSYTKGCGAISLAETASVGLCGLAVLLWMSIGSFSRSEARELLAQQVIAALCVTSAVLLFALHQMGGELWGSRNWRVLWQS